MRMTVRLILALTLEELGVGRHEWEATCGKGGRFTKRLARAGQLAVATGYTRTSISQIGKAIGRDHTTVLYARKRMPEILATEPDIARAAKRIEERMERLAALPADSAEARALLPQPGKGPHPAEARPSLVFERREGECPRTASQSIAGSTISPARRWRSSTRARPRARTTGRS